MSWIRAVSHSEPTRTRTLREGGYLFSQTVPQILLLAKDNHSILLSNVRTALLSCFCRRTGHTE